MISPNGMNTSEIVAVIYRYWEEKMKEEINVFIEAKDETAGSGMSEMAKLEQTLTSLTRLEQRLMDFRNEVGQGKTFLNLQTHKTNKLGKPVFPKVHKDLKHGKYRK